MLPLVNVILSRDNKLLRYDAGIGTRIATCDGAMDGCRGQRLNVEERRRKGKMKNFQLLMYVAFLCSALLVPCIAGAVPSDVLVFTFIQDGITNTQTRTIVEGGGESVGETIDIHVNDPRGLFNQIAPFTNFVWLVEPGDPFTSATPLADTTPQFRGSRSDQITLLLNQEAEAGGGHSISVTLNSDEDPGPGDQVTGYLETGDLQDITSGIFTADELAIFAQLGDTVMVQVASDVETTTSTVPEPATLFLLGLGLFGVGIVGRKIKK
jgi:PEP-CTERM motif